jgi:Sulfotransferase family
MTSPVFILGALRSGTTVFRLMLDSHGEIANPGEADFLFRFLKGEPATNRWTYDVPSVRQDRIFQSYGLEIPPHEDGAEIVRGFVAQFAQRSPRMLTLNIHGHLDKVVALFPGAKIVHLIRDPRDVAKSCVGMGWAGNTYYGVDQWIETERDWDRNVGKFSAGQITELHYEDLIIDPRRELEKVCRFLGVPFSADMLNYPAHSTYERPNPSAVQPWKLNLAPREIALAEIKTRPLLLSRGYGLSGHPLDPPLAPERARLFLQNKIYRWNFSCRRYGVFNCVMEKITREFALSHHYVFAQRMNEITNRYLQ